jgi:hypothetical protein
MDRRLPRRRFSVTVSHVSHVDPPCGLRWRRTTSFPGISEAPTFSQTSAVSAPTATEVYITSRLAAALRGYRASSSTRRSGRNPTSVSPLSHERFGTGAAWCS